MPMQYTSHFPSLAVPDELYEIVDALAQQERDSISGIVRSCVERDPRIIALARERGVTIPTLKRWRRPRAVQP